MTSYISTSEPTVNCVLETSMFYAKTNKTQVYYYNTLLRKYKMT